MVARRLRWRDIAILTSFVVLSCDSGPIPFARLIQGTITDCTDTTERIVSRREYWVRVLEGEPQFAPVTSNWQERAATLQERFPGVLVQVRVSRVADIVLERTRSRAEGIHVEKWHDGRAQLEWFFTADLGSVCGLVKFSPEDVLVAVAMPEGGLPPEHIAPFLGVDQLSRSPKLFLNYWELN